MDVLRKYLHMKRSILSLLIFANVFIVLFVFALAVRILFPDLIVSLSEDSVSFEARAREIAEAIARDGWGVWSLAPDGQGPIGIAAFMFVVFGGSVVPILFLNATLLAGAATAIVRLIMLLQPKIRYPAVGALAFLLPSASFVTAVLHKDPFAILGVSLVLLGTSLSVRSGRRRRLIVAALGLVLVAVGAGAIWLVRPYANLLLLGAVCLYVFTFLATGIWIRLRGSALLLGLVGGLLCIFILFIVLQLPALEGRSQPSSLVQPSQQHWGGVLMAPLDAAFAFLLDERNEYIQCCSDATTAIDVDVRLLSVGDIVAYLPRAATIGLLSPFPGDWMKPERPLPLAVLVGIEMSLVYLALIGVFVALARSSSIDLLPAIVFILAVILVITIAVPNVGTLYRMRLPYFLPMIGIGFAVLADLAPKRKLC
ncbi:hypothetical protein [Parasphingorhabdus sp.]|jgi:hypothetical protein|uniref:hypothetical protein n=1 Tax=Parasphingorhabdus sp. TaxID=2709688 RepID=UPI0032EFB51F